MSLNRGGAKPDGVAISGLWDLLGGASEPPKSYKMLM